MFNPKDPRPMSGNAQKQVAKKRVMNELQRSSGKVLHKIERGFTKQTPVGGSAGSPTPKQMPRNIMPMPLPKGPQQRPKPMPLTPRNQPKLTPADLKKMQL
jgi:hypothetical protein